MTSPIHVRDAHRPVVPRRSAAAAAKGLLVVPSGSMVLVALLAALATAAGGLLYGGLFSGTGHVTILLVATLGGLLFGLIAGVWRGSLSYVLPIGAVVAGLFTAYVAFPETLFHGLPSWRTVVELCRGVGTGWARLLSAGVPAEASGDLLAGPMVVQFSAAAAAAGLALRRTSAIAPVVPPLVVFVVALALTGPAVRASWLPTTLFSGAVGLSLAVRAKLRPGPPAGAGFVVVALAVATGLLVGRTQPLARGADRADASQLLRSPVEVAPVVNPLSMVKWQLRQESAQVLFEVEPLGGVRLAATRPDGPTTTRDRIRLASLDRFDGVSWTTQARHLAVGRGLAAEELPGTAQTQVRITVTRLTGPFLPVIGQPQRIDGHPLRNGRMGFSEEAGTLVSTASDLAGLSYTVISAVRDVDGAGTSFETAIPGGGPPWWRQLPGKPPEQATMLVDRITTAHGRPVDQLRAIEQHLTSLRYDVAAPPGHSYAAIARLLGSGPGSGTGHAEQYASAFAVLARMLGYPARVAVGYRLPVATNGVYRITTRDAYAWPEVHFPDFGWVPFDPIGTTASTSVPDRADGGDQIAPTPPSDATATPPTPSPEAWSELGPAHDESADSVWVALVLLAMAGLLGVPGIKVLRRWRRRRGPPAARVLGAWADTRDRLWECGLVVTAAMTPREVAGWANKALSATTSAAPGEVRELWELAEIVTAAVFGPDSTDDRTAREAWRLADRIRQRLRHPVWSYRRYLAWWHLGPLLAGVRPVTGRADRW